MDRADWKRIDQNKLPIQDSIEALHDFKEVVTFEPMVVGGERKLIVLHESEGLFHDSTTSSTA